MPDENKIRRRTLAEKRTYQMVVGYEKETRCSTLVIDMDSLKEHGIKEVTLRFAGESRHQLIAALIDHIDYEGG